MTRQENCLAEARSLEMPSRDAILMRDQSVTEFWSKYEGLLECAWAEWENSDQKRVDALKGSFIDQNLRQAIETAWKDPEKEQGVRELLTEEAPDVYSFQFFDPSRIGPLRDYLSSVWDAGLPIRPPYGIVLNRSGAMLDKRSEGYLAAPQFQEFYKELTDTYMRPISRLLFSEVMGFDSQTFGFSINYKPSTDTSIRTHSDASSVTLNINLNRVGEEFTGSTVDFFDPASRTTTSLSFEPGTALIHRGNAIHTAQPITSGERTNFVLWLYGDHGSLPSQQEEARQRLDPQERWTTPVAYKDKYAPF